MNSIHSGNRIIHKSDKAGKLKLSNREEFTGRRDQLSVSLKKGQLIAGTVTAAGEQITISILGQDIIAPAGAFRNAAVGENKLFEVLNITDQHIELKAVDNDGMANRKAFVAFIMNTELDILQSRKSHAGKQAVREKEYRDNKDRMDEIVSKMTERDYRVLEEEGFPVEEFSVGGLSKALDRIKNMATANKKSGAGDRPQQLPGKRGRSAMPSEHAIRERLKEANLPVTGETVSKIMNGLALSDALPEIGEHALKNMIRNGLPPTIENLYKEQYTNDAPGRSKKLSEAELRELLPQIREILNTEGYEADKENLGYSLWLVENDLPLSGKNLAYIKSFEELSRYSDKEAVLDRIIEGMADGREPEDALMLPEYPVSAEEIVEDIHSIREETVKRAVREDMDLTVSKLIKLQESPVTEGDSRQELTKEQMMAAIRAQRQLEEIRLKMTLDAAARLLKQGFSIETKELEEVVAKLKALEEECYRNLLSEADLAADNDKLQVLEEAVRSMEELKTAPAYVLGTTLFARSLQTVPSILEAGTNLAAKLNKAGEAYETLMTIPSGEYGDSIQRAFMNSGSLLAEIGLEDTDLNRRALRILGYNRMEITLESVRQVKAYDLEVNALMKNMHPAVTVRLIKDGINPMELTVSELNQKIEKLKQELGISDREKFSTFLQRLDRNERLPETERNAYIGIYRLLHAIEKSDGAALGAVINSGRTVTLSHLLSAVRTFRLGGMDTAVDDRFGALQKTSSNSETITEQIDPAFSRGRNQAQEQEAPAGEEDRTEFMKLLLKRLTEEVTPEKLDYVHRSLPASTEVSSREQLGAPLLSSDRGIWETIKDTSIETLYDGISRAGENHGAEDPVYGEKLMELRETFKNSDQAVRFLDDFKIPCTAVNLLAAGQILSTGGSLFKKLFRLKEDKDGRPENELKEISELSDKLIDRQTMEEAYELLENEVNEAAYKELQAERIDKLKLAELRSIGIQMSLAKALAKREFYQIPLDTGDGITNVNLTILRGTGTTGKLAVTVHSGKLGRINAEMSLKDRTLTGLIICDNTEGLSLISRSMDGLKEMLNGEGIIIRHMDLCLQKSGYENYVYRNNLNGISPDDAPPENSTRETERLLYRIATITLMTVRAAEALVKALVKDGDTAVS